jgi:hypothetical protein
MPSSRAQRDEVYDSKAITKVHTVRERLEVLTREQERYNATVKALKIDLTMLHGAECMPSGFLNGKNIDKLAYERYMDAFVGGVTLEGRCIGWFGR